MAINKKVLWIGIGSAVLISGGFIWWYLKSENSNSGSGNENSNDNSESGNLTKSNFDQLIENTKLKPISNKIGVTFPNGKNKATYFNNGRVFIFSSDNKQLGAGSYSEGGKTITMDGKQPVSDTNWSATLVKALATIS